MLNICSGFIQNMTALIGDTAFQKAIWMPDGSDLFTSIILLFLYCMVQSFSSFFLCSKCCIPEILSFDTSGC